MTTAFPPGDRFLPLSNAIITSMGSCLAHELPLYFGRIQGPPALLADSTLLRTANAVLPAHRANGSTVEFWFLLVIEPSWSAGHLIHKVAFRAPQYLALLEGYLKTWHPDTWRSGEARSQVFHPLAMNEAGHQSGQPSPSTFSTDLSQGTNTFSMRTYTLPELRKALGH
jgi:hypothetical protein